MKKIIYFVKERIITGLIVLVPVIVIGVILADSIKKLLVITAPLTKIFSFAGPFIETIVAIIVITIVLVFFFFISGLILQTYLGKSLANWLEKKVLQNIPFYTTLKAATKQLTGVEKENYPVVEVNLYGNKNKSLGLLTETLTDGNYVVYIPYAPIMNIGQIHIVAKENVKFLDIPFRNLVDIISKVGFESDKILK